MRLKHLLSVFLTLLTLSVGQMWGANATMTGGTNATASTFSSASGYKCGTGKGGGSMTVTIPAGATVLSVYVAGWSGDNPTVSISRSSGTISSSSVSPTCDSGISGGSSSYTLANAESTYLQTFTLSSVNSETTVTFSTSAKNKRFGVWGAKICYSPTSLTNTTIGSTTATLGWSDAKNVNSYEVYYSTSSTAPTASSSGTTTTSKSINLTSLTSSQQYYWWVRAYDSYCKSAWVAGSSFTTTASGCTNNINIGKGSESHGTFELSKSGSQATCSGLSVVVTPDADDHYHVSSVSATTGETGTDNGDGTWTITYAANTTGSSTINVVFAEDPAATISFENAGTPAPTTTGYYVDDSYTLPSSNNYSCSGGKTFVGWSTVEVASQDTKPSSNFHEPGASVTLGASQTFRAVFANATPGEAVKYDPFSATLGGSNGNTITSGYTLTTQASSQAGYYQDGSGTLRYVQVASTTAMFSSTPSSISVTAKIGGGTSNTDLANPVYAQLVDANGDPIGTAAIITEHITTNTGDTYSNISIPTTGITSAYGLRIYHTKESGYNVRYYSMSLSYTVDGTTYSAYSTTCCTPLGSINGSVSWTNGTQATLTWDKLSDVRSSNPYEVSVSPNAGVTVNAVDLTGAKATCSVTGLTAGTAYTFTINAYGNATHCDASQEISATAAKITAPASATALSGSDYAEGATTGGTPKSFTVSGVGLTGNLTVLAPSGFEVCGTQNGTYTGSIELSASGSGTYNKTITDATVWVRLKSGASKGSYGPSAVTISGGGAANNTNVTIAGSVTSSCEAPVVATPTCTSVADGTITVSCASITVGQNCDVDEYGFVWKASSEPSISDNKTPNAGAYAANFSKALTIDGFATGTTYNIKAYGHNAAGYALSSNLAVTPRKVTFSKNGHGTQSVPATQYMVDGGKATQPSALTDPNYTFGGWYKEAGCSNAWDFANDVVSDGDQELYAKWTPKDYTITTTLNNVNISAAIASPYTYTGSAAGINRTFSVDADNFFMPEDIVVTMAGTGTLVKNTGYTYDSSNGAFELTATITGNVTITATATAKLKSIAITAQPTTRKYLVGDVFSSTGATVTATMGDGSTKTVSATWTPSTALSAGESQTVTATYEEGGIEKTATTTIDVYSVTVNKVDMNGDGIDDANVTATCSGRTLSQSVGSTKYKFNSWEVSEGGVSISTNTITGAPSGAVVINAKFHKPIAIAWKVGTGMATGGSTEVKYGTAMNTLSLPTAPLGNALASCGTNTFMGWSEHQLIGAGHDDPGDLFKSITATTPINEDKTFYAVFAKASGSGSADDFVLVEEGLSDWSGEYILVNYSDNNKALKNTVTSGKFGCSNVSPENNKITSTDNKIIWIFEKGTGDNAAKYSIKSKDSEKYAGIGSSSTSGSLSDSKSFFTITHYSQSHQNDVAVDNGRFFSYYAKDNEFRTYSGDYNGVYLYKRNEVTYSDYQTSCCTTLDAVSNVSVVPGRTSATVSWDMLANASGYEYKLGDAEWATASVADANNPSISLSTLSGATSYAIQIRATGDGTTYCDKGTASAVTNFKTLSRVTAAVNNGERGAAKVSLNGEDWAASVDAADGTTIYLQATPSSASWTLGSWGASNGDVASNQLTGWTGDVTVTANFAAAELPTLATPTGMSSSAVTAISATISWNAVANASSYAISCTPSATQGDVTESAGVCSCTLTGLSAGTEYTWNVQAVGDNFSYKSGAACADQTFTTVAKQPIAVAVTTAPGKTSYLEGESFDATGMVVRVTYNTEEVDDDADNYTVTPSGALEYGTTNVTITVNGSAISTTQAITVVKKYVLTFKNNGVEVSHKDLYEGAAYGTLPTLTSENACNATFTNFVGWTTDEITEQQSSKPTLVTATTTMSNADVTLNAVWSDFVPTDYATTYTSNVTLPTENNSTNCYYVSKVTIGGVEYDGVKVGKSGNGGHFTINVPAGTKRLFVHGVSWNNEDNTLTVSTAAEGVSISPNTAVTLPRNSGLSGSGNDFTLGTLDGTEYKTFTLTGVESTTTLTLTSSGRIDVFGIMASSSTGSGYYVTRCISSEVTIATLTHGSTITVKNGNESVDSGDEIAAGTTLTITTDAASGYRVENLRAYKTGDENTPVAITEGSLTMPIYGITITADETAVYPVSVAVAAGQSTWGSVTIDGEAGPAYVNEDDTPEMVATPNAGYQFKTWSVTGGSYDLGDKALTNASIAPQVYAEATFTATFEEKPMTGLTLSESALTVDLASGTASLNVTGYTPSDLLDAKKTIAWSSSDETVATVSNGTITLKKAGTATITAAWTEDESVNASCALNVYQWNFTGYEVTTAPETLYSNGDQFDKSSVVIKAGYERSDNSSTKQVTLEAAAWTAKLDGSAIADNYAFALADNGKTLTLWVGESQVGSDYVLTVNTIPTDHFVINIWTSEVSPIADKTSAYSMPSLSDQTAGAAATCKDHNLFVGWVEETYKDEPEGHIVAANTAMTPSNKTFYAVWGKTGTITESISYGWESTDDATKWSMSTKNEGLEATTGSARTGTYGGSMTSTGAHVQTLSKYATPKGITYYIRKQSGNDKTSNYFVLRYSSDNSNWTEIESTKYTFKQLSNTTWTEVTCDLRAETYQNKYFEIRMISGADGSLDDIEFSYTTSGAVDYITECVQRYQITFDANGGTGSYDAIEKKEGATVTLPDGSALSRAAEHYHFNGWKVYNTSTEEEISVSENQFTMPGAAVNAVAQWEEDPKGTIRYVGDEIVDSPVYRYAGQTYNLRSQVTLPANKKLVGWTIDGDETLYAPGRTMTMPNPVQDITYHVQIIDQLPTPSGVSFSGGEWVLVTNSDQLNAGDFVVIVANETTNAMGAQSTSNRSVASVTKHNEGQTITITSGVATLFLQYGYREGEFALYDMAEEGYLYAVSTSANQLKTSATYTDRNYSWLITIGEGNIASIVAQGDKTHNDLKYNPNSGSPLFSCYTSGQTAVQLYRYDGHKTVEITENVNASAIYLDDADVVVKDGKTLTIDVASDLDNLTVEAGGKVSGSETLIVQDLTIKTSLGTISGDDNDGGKSGEISNSNITANGDVWIEIELTQASEASWGWYAFSVPFPVNTMNGVYYQNTPLQNEVGYAIMAYHEDERAAGNYAWKKYRETNLVPGMLYIITVGDTDYKTLRFKKVKDEALIASTSVPVSYTTATGDGASGWNGVGNPNLQVSHQNDFTYLQFLDHDDNCFRARTAATTDLLVGTAFMVQVAESTENITITTGANDGEGNIALAPAREPKAIENTIFEVKLVNAETNRTEDNLFLTAREDATNEYEIGRDVTKMSMGTAKCAQMWVPAYGTNLCAADFQLVNNKATYPLTINALSAGTYTISTTATENATLYLTKNGRIYWNLTMGACELELNQGQNNEYGLVLRAEVPAVTTGVENGELLNGENGVQKVVIDEHVYILRGGEMYDMTGKMVK